MDLPAADELLDRQTVSRPAFLAAWLAPQLAALALSALRVPLWARFPQAGELLALPLMLAVQIAAASVMLPLFEDWTHVATAIMASWPMGLIAGSLSAARFDAVVTGEIDVALWIVAVAAASTFCRSRRARASGCVLMTMWSIGGGLLLYLRSEFLSAAGSLPGLMAGPLVAAVNGPTPNRNLIFWLPLPPLIILLVILSFFRGRRLVNRRK
jgi:hypothetical protein